MIERFFKSARTRRRIASSHLNIIFEPFVRDLHARGYTRQGICHHVAAVEHFGRWLKDRGVRLTQLSTRHVQEFLSKHLLRCGCPTPAPKSPRNCRAGLGRLVEFLRSHHQIREFQPKAPPPTPTDQLMAAYDRHLGGVWGLSEGTRRRRQRSARRFLQWRFGSRRPRLRQLRARNISDFVLWGARRFGPAGTRALTASLRSFLGFLEFSGRLPKGLVQAVPQLKGPATPAPTKFLTPKHRRSFLRSFARATPGGRRDYAIALCLCALALRVQEVVALTLDDLDWRAMTVCLRQTKQGRERLLPLPAPVARAILDYLKRGRPPSQSRALFLHYYPPLDRALRAQSVRRLVGRVFARCGIKASGAHILRHTWATWAHRRGTDLKVIADLLGHRSVETTQRYAHVNLEELRQVALPWPRTRR
jgi:integrase/recombinase XerD